MLGPAPPQRDLLTIHLLDEQIEQLTYCPHHAVYPRRRRAVGSAIRWTSQESALPRTRARRREPGGGTSNAPTEVGGDDGLRVLVVVGLRDDGVNDLLAVGDGCRASTESWSGAMYDLRDRAQRAVPGDR